MKTLGRILVIVVAFALVMGITYVAVNAGISGGVANALQFEGNRDAPPGGQRPAFANGERPEFRGGERGEFRGGFGWIFGAVKNTVVVAVIVAAIVVPKGWLRRRKRAAQAVLE